MSRTLPDIQSDKRFTKDGWRVTYKPKNRPFMTTNRLWLSGYLMGTVIQVRVEGTTEDKVASIRVYNPATKDTVALLRYPNMELVEAQIYVETLARKVLKELKEKEEEQANKHLEESLKQINVAVSTYLEEEEQQLNAVLKPKTKLFTVDDVKELAEKMQTDLDKLAEEETAKQEEPIWIASGCGNYHTLVHEGNILAVVVPKDEQMQTLLLFSTLYESVLEVRDIAEAKDAMSHKLAQGAKTHLFSHIPEIKWEYRAGHRVYELTLNNDAVLATVIYSNFNRDWTANTLECELGASKQFKERDDAMRYAERKLFMEYFTQDAYPEKITLKDVLEAYRKAFIRKLANNELMLSKDRDVVMTKQHYIMARLG